MRPIQWASKRMRPQYLGYFLSLCSVHFEDGEIKRPEVTFAMTAKQSSREEMTGWLDDSEIDPEMICALLSLLVSPCLSLSLLVSPCLSLSSLVSLVLHRCSGHTLQNIK